MKQWSPRIRKIAISALLALIMIAFVMFFTREREPEYNGEPLSYWVAVYGGLDPPNVTSEETAEASDVIRSIGTNALPFLLKWTDYEPSAMDEWFVDNQDRFPDWMTSVGPFQWSRQAYFRTAGALQAFKLLGPLAGPAIPELRSRLDDTESYRAGLAFGSLMFIGPAATPIAIEVISDPVTNISRYATQLSFLTALGTNMTAVWPTLVNNLQHTNAGIAVTTVEHSFLWFNDRPKEFTSALTNGLADSRVEIRRAFANTLVYYGEKSALPALTNALSDSDAEVRETAKHAISQIRSRN